ncbi:MAG TPA: POTRA domain-containing protein [Bryobacteraceae bacterium]|nr:POTRA domain-containing protein [Bryobacteraceae bacterium]
MIDLRVALYTLCVSSLLAQGTAVEIRVTGNERVAPAAVIAASGLRVGSAVTRTALDAAAQKTLDTGFFSNVSYRYDPKGKGYAVTLQVTEEPAVTPVELDIPGQDTEKLWQQLKATDSLIDRRIPGNDRASTYFGHVMEAVLKKSDHPTEIVMKSESNLSKMWLSCRPAHLPTVSAISFEGNYAITPTALKAALSKVTLGEEYTERDFLRKLELNIRPMYEQLGRLTVSFQKPRMVAAGADTVAVAAEIDEGPVWRLGNVDLNGDALPVAAMRDAAQFAVGAPANWTQFMISIQNMEKVLRRDGYLRVFSTPVRAFRATGEIVDVHVEVRKGLQFLFGKLYIDGLDADTRESLASQWKLPAGAPMNEFYITDYMRSVLPPLRGKFKTYRSEMRPHAGTNLMDVTLIFR